MQKITLYFDHNLAPDLADIFHIIGSKNYIGSVFNCSHVTAAFPGTPDDPNLLEKISEVGGIWVTLDKKARTGHSDAIRRTACRIIFLDPARGMQHKLHLLRLMLKHLTDVEAWLMGSDQMLFVRERGVKSER